MPLHMLCPLPGMQLCSALPGKLQLILRGLAPYSLLWEAPEVESVAPSFVFPALYLILTCGCFPLAGQLFGGMANSPLHLHHQPRTGLALPHE